ncbi:hypothetical protein EON73_00700, partial [bacterium]
AAKIFAKKVHNDNQKWINNPVETQQKVFKDLIKKAQNTHFGKDHNFSQIKSFSDFATLVLGT